VAAIIEKDFRGRKIALFGLREARGSSEIRSRQELDYDNDYDNDYD
jgi:hypothetical protein